MARKKYPLNRINKKGYYLIEGITILFGITRRTVQNMLKQGLKILCRKKPFLIYGQDLFDFLKERKSENECTLLEDEFFCPRCRCPRKSLVSFIKYEKTDKMLGKNYARQVIIRGVCEVCYSPLNRFSSDKKIKDNSIKEIMLERQKSPIGKTKRKYRKRSINQVKIPEQLVILFGN